MKKENKQAVDVNNVSLCSDGRYLIRVTVNGKRIPRYIPVADTKNKSSRELKKFLESERTKFEDECRIGKPTPQTFAVVADEWYNTMTVGVLQETSRKQYEGQLPRIIKAIGHIRIDRLTDYDIKAFINELAKKSPGVVENNLAIISHVCKLGKSRGMITVNPAETVKLPKRPKKPKEIYTREEVVKLLKAVETHENPQFRLFVTLAAYTGMRTGEMLGLAWKDVDFKKRTVYIHQQLVKPTGEALCMNNQTKNRVERIITVPTDVIDVLREWQDLQRYDDNKGMVFSKNGAYMPKHSFTWHLKALCKSCGIKYRPPHRFRHSVASILIADGESPATVAEYIGDKISTVLEYYVHAEAETVRQASNTICTAFTIVQNGISLVSAPKKKA